MNPAQENIWTTTWKLDILIDIHKIDGTLRNCSNDFHMYELVLFILVMEGVGSNVMMKQCENNVFPVHGRCCLLFEHQRRLLSPHRSLFTSRRKKWVNNFTCAVHFRVPYGKCDWSQQAYSWNKSKDCSAPISFSTIPFIVRLPYWFIAEIPSSTRSDNSRIRVGCEAGKTYSCEYLISRP